MATGKPWDGSLHYSFSQCAILGIFMRARSPNSAVNTTSLMWSAAANHIQFPLTSSSSLPLSFPPSPTPSLPPPLPPPVPLPLSPSLSPKASTSELFGKVQESPQRETTPFYPRSPYGTYSTSLLPPLSLLLPPPSSLPSFLPPLSLLSLLSPSSSLRPPLSTLLTPNSSLLAPQLLILVGGSLAMNIIIFLPLH